MNKASCVFQIAKGVVIAVVFSLAAVLVFALAIKIFSIPSEAITYVDQVIKAAAILVGCIFSLKEDKGLLKGAITGVIGVVLTYFIFSAIGDEFNFSLLFLLELLFGAVIGGISGIIAVNIRK